jgi:hypothetical protein
MSPVTLAQRFYLGAVAGLALWVGIWCYFIPARSALAIPWLLPPLCATFLGSMYLSGAVFTAGCMSARRWTDIRVVMPMIAMWTGGLAIISLFYLPAFDFARTQVLIWFGAYILYPLIALWLSWTHRRQPAPHLLSEPSLPQWVRLYLLGQGSLMTVLGLGLLLGPGAMQPLWPWQAGPMMLQLYAAPLLAYGIGSLMLMNRRAWSEIRLALVAMAVFTGAELVASVRYDAFLNGPSPAIAFWFIWLALTTAMLGVLSVLAFRRPADPAHDRGSQWRLPIHTE